MKLDAALVGALMLPGSRRPMATVVPCCRRSPNTGPQRAHETVDLPVFMAPTLMAISLSPPQAPNSVAGQKTEVAEIADGVVYARYYMEGMVGEHPYRTPLPMCGLEDEHGASKSCTSPVRVTAAHTALKPVILRTDVSTTLCHSGPL